jgi:outer membrane protein TolC
MKCFFDMGTVPGRCAPGIGLRIICVIVASLLGYAGNSRAAAESTNALPSQPISLAEALDLAIQCNPAIQKARKDLEATEGVVLQTRAIAWPKVQVTGNYAATEPSGVDKPPLTIPGFTFGTDQSWHSQVRLVQSIYEGGRVVSGLRAARLLREQALLNYQTTLANAILDVELAYYAVLLQTQQITVQEASVLLLERELKDTQQRLEAGSVPRFNVLRAEVELANARPRLIRARNGFHIAKNILANLLGLDVPRGASQDIPLTLSGALTPEPLEMDLPTAVSQALAGRSELGALRKTGALLRENVRTARSGYKPSVQAFGGYQAQSSIFSSDLDRELHGWMAGVQLTWDVFDGWRTRGRVMEAAANVGRNEVEQDNAGRQIELEVRTAFSSFVEAREVLDSQKKVLEAAEEALRLARSRGEAGSGTQLDVLGAQTALTEARTTQVLALHDYAAARAKLRRAVGNRL